MIDTTLRGPFGDLALSRDGRRLAIRQLDGGTWNVWTKELDRGPMGKLTLDGRVNFGPAWTFDGGAVTFVSDRDSGQTGLFERRADGSASPQRLLRVDRSIDYGFLTRDRQWIIYQTEPAPGSRDIFARRVSGDTATIPLAASASAGEMSPRLSPDGRWLAYVASESGQREVYVSPFPNTSASRTQVSLNGGEEPLWSPDGRELFYQTLSLELTAARIEASPPAIRVASRTPLFSRASYNRDFTTGTMYDVSPDGKRFIMTRRRGDASERLIVVLNWFTELQAAARQ